MDTSSNGPIVRLQSICKRFGQNEVLKDISLEIAPGEVVVVFGRSGSGKSTMLRCINLLEEPTSGRLVVDGIGYEPGPLASPLSRSGARGGMAGAAATATRAATDTLIRSKGTKMRAPCATAAAKGRSVTTESLGGAEDVDHDEPHAPQRKPVNNARRPRDAPRRAGREARDGGG